MTWAGWCAAVAVALLAAAVARQAVIDRRRPDYGVPNDVHYRKENHH